MKIFVGIPIYDSKVPMQLVDNLLAENTLAHITGHRLVVRFLPSCCNLAKGRNQLVKDFLNSDCDRLVFVDADITFEPGSLIRLAETDSEFVAGAYRFKRDLEDYPIGWIQGDLQADERGLLGVAMVPTGFLALSRSVFEKFQEAHPGREYTIEGSTSYCFFQIPYADGSLYTEDAYFCREWRELGGKIYLDPEITLTHWDHNKPYKGNIGQWLRRLNGIEVPA